MQTLKFDKLCRATRLCLTLQADKVCTSDCDSNVVLLPCQKVSYLCILAGFLSCKVRGEFLRGFRKIPDLGMAVAQGLFSVALEPMCNYVLQGRSTMSVMGLRNLVLDQPQR